MVARVRRASISRCRPAICGDPARALGRDRFSPKASLAWSAGRQAGTAQLSFGQAWRFPTVGELYQIVTTPVAGRAQPQSAPRTRAVGRTGDRRIDANGSVRLSLFNEVVDGRADLADRPAQRRPGGRDLRPERRSHARARRRAGGRRAPTCSRASICRAASTYADATTRAERRFPGGGRQAASRRVPHWKATAVATWRPGRRRRR